jgi:ribokinase
MKKNNQIYVSGMLNFEADLKVGNFPLHYYPIDYPFFDIDTSIGGSGYNISMALRNFNNDVTISGFVGKDRIGKLIIEDLKNKGFSTHHVHTDINDTPTNIVLFDNFGRRQVHCDLKNAQDLRLDWKKEKAAISKADLLVLTNINFNRPLLAEAKKLGKKIATDVQIITDVEDAFNKDFMEAADILFLTNDGLSCNYEDFLVEIYNRYHNEIIVLGEGTKGAMILDAKKRIIYHIDAVYTRPRLNTFGSGDALFSAFVNYYLKGWDSLKCLKYATAFASWKIGERGSSKGFLKNASLMRLVKGINFSVYEIKRF